MTAQLTRLEAAVIASIYELWPDHAEAIRRQLAVAAVVDRVNTGGGLFTNFDVPPDVPPIPPGMPTSGHVEIDGLEYGMGFHLASRNGLLDHLEGATYGEDLQALDLERAAFRIVR